MIFANHFETAPLLWVRFRSGTKKWTPHRGCPGNRNRFAFSFSLAENENRGSHQCLHWWQQVSAGHLRCYGFDSGAAPKKDTP